MLSCTRDTCILEEAWKSSIDIMLSLTTLQHFIYTWGEAIFACIVCYTVCILRDNCSCGDLQSNFSIQDIHIWSSPYHSAGLLSSDQWEAKSKMLYSVLRDMGSKLHSVYLGNIGQLLCLNCIMGIILFYFIWCPDLKAQVSLISEA